MSRQHDLVSPLRSFFDFPFSEKNFWEVDLPTSPSGLEVSEDRDHVYVKAHLPGLSLEEIEVFFERGILTIQGEHKEEDKEEDKGKKYYRKASNSFSYQIRVPGTINEGKEPDATYKDGVMTVTFAKGAHAETKKVQIKKG